MKLRLLLVVVLCKFNFSFSQEKEKLANLLEEVVSIKELYIYNNELSRKGDSIYFYLDNKNIDNQKLAYDIWHLCNDYTEIYLGRSDYTNISIFLDPIIFRSKHISVPFYIIKKIKYRKDIIILEIEESSFQFLKEIKFYKFKIFLMINDGIKIEKYKSKEIKNRIYPRLKIK